MDKKTYAVKACTNGGYRKRTAIVVGFLALLSLLSVVMLIISFITGKVLWGVFWIIALILAVTYVIIRFNSVYTTYLASDKKNVYMRNWTNDFLPYDADCKVKFIREFIPAKTKLIKIPIEDISTVLIGTKNFIKRYGEDNEEFRASLAPLEKAKDYYQKKTVQSMDLFYISTRDQECYFMPIVKFSPRDVSRVLQFITRENPNVEVKVNSRDFRTSLKK